MTLTFESKGKIYKVTPFASRYLVELVSKEGFVLKTIGYYSRLIYNTIDKLEKEVLRAR